MLLLLRLLLFLVQSNLLFVYCFIEQPEGELRPRTDPSENEPLILCQAWVGVEMPLLCDLPWFIGPVVLLGSGQQ